MIAPNEPADLVRRGYEELGAGHLAAASDLFGQALALIERRSGSSPDLVMLEADALGGLRLSTVHDEQVDWSDLAVREVGSWQRALRALGPAAVGEECARALSAIGTQALVVGDLELAGAAVEVLEDLFANAEPPAELDEEFASSAAAYIDSRSVIADLAWAKGEAERSIAVLDDAVLLLDLWGGYPYVGGWDRRDLRQATLVSRLLRRVIAVGRDRAAVSPRCDALVELLRAAFAAAMEQGDEDGAVAAVRLLPAAADHARAAGRPDLVDTVADDLEHWVEALAAGGGVAGQVVAGDLEAFRTNVRRE